MKIKNLIFAIFATASLFVACDVIPENDRLTEVELTPSDRTVLLVEFTGNRCVNCPGAAMVAHDMLEVIPENVVVVGMHPAGIVYTNPMDPTIDLSSADAMEYLKFYGGSQSTGLPVGVVNGRQFDGTYLQGSSKWTAQVFAQREIAPKCLIGLNHAVEGANHTVVATLKPQVAIESASLLFWLVESNIVGPQSIDATLVDSYQKANPNAEINHGTVSNYVHNHVFRACLNGFWGEELDKLSAISNDPTAEVVDLPTKSCTFSIDEKYVADNCSVVAVLVDTNTKEVIQAAEIALGEGSKH
jgi:hypothetical protein